MGNEIFFLMDVVGVTVFTLLAARFGKEALTASIALNAILANLFIAKQMVFFGCTVTCSDVFIVGSLFGLNLLQEFYGKSAAKKATNISFVALLFFLFVSQVHLWFYPASMDQTQDAFETILSWTPRIVVSSLIVYFLVQKIDVFFFGILKNLFQGKILPFRITCSLVLSQGIDTALFSFLGLYGIVSSIWDVMIVSFLVKCLVILASAPISIFARRFMKAAHEV